MDVQGTEVVRDVTSEDDPLMRLPPERVKDLQSLAPTIEKFLAAGRLDPREAQILKLRLGLDRGTPRSLEEVGALYDLPGRRIRQIEARAMQKLRDADRGFVWKT